VLSGDSHGVQLKMSHTTVKESQGWGLWVTGSGILTSFEGNTLTKNTLGFAKCRHRTTLLPGRTSQEPRAGRGTGLIRH
jgi:hypothetical protein